MCRLVVALTVLALIACGSPRTPGHAVIEAFADAGIKVENVQPGKLAPDSELPQTYREYLVFTIPDLDSSNGRPEIGEKGGQIFVCDTKVHCDFVFNYYDRMPLFFTRWIYQSPDGRVVVRLNTRIGSSMAAQVEQVVDALPRLP